MHIIKSNKRYTVDLYVLFQITFDYINVISSVILQIGTESVAIDSLENGPKNG